MGSLPTGKYYKKHLLSRDDNRVNLRIRPQTEVIQIVDFPEGVYRVIRPILMFYGDKISLMFNDAKYQTTQQMIEITNLLLKEYAYTKDEINKIFEDIKKYTKDENTKKDREIATIEEEVNGLYDKYKKIIDENDFLNVSPKIGLFQEDTLNVLSSYKINYIVGEDIKRRRTPVITSDNTGKQVMYYIANDGGYNRESIDNLHKAYRLNLNTSWIHINDDVVPYYFRNTNYRMVAIHGCDNDYLVVQMANNKYWLIHTDFSFDPNDWKNADDISSMITNDTATDLLLHVKYLKDYNTLITVNGLRRYHNNPNWYRVRVYNYSTKALLRSEDLPGSMLFKLKEGYSYSTDRVIDYALDLGPNDPEFVASTGPHEDLHCCSVLIHENQNILSIIIEHTNAYVYNSKGSKEYCTIYATPLTYTIPIEVVRGNNQKRSNGEYVYKITPNFGPKECTLPGSGIYTAAQIKAVTGVKEYGHEIVCDQVNNSSYDSYNQLSYRSCAHYQYDSYFRYVEYKDSELIASDPRYNGLKHSYYSDKLYTPDASIWGKALLSGFIMWDNVFLVGRSTKGLSLIWVTKWRFVEGLENKLVIEPVPGYYKVLDKANVSDVLQFSTVSGLCKFITNNHKRYQDSFTFPQGIISVKNTDKTVSYYKADYNDKKIYIYEFTKTNTYKSSNNVIPVDFKITKTLILTVNVDITKSLFNTGDNEHTFVYGGFVAYNPLSNMCFVFGVLDEGEITDTSDTNIGITQIVGVKIGAVTNKVATGTTVTYGTPKSKRWNYSGLDTKINNYESQYRTPFIPTGCNIIDEHTMQVFFREIHSGGRSACKILYQFNTTNTNYTTPHCASIPGGIYYGAVGGMLESIQDHMTMYSGSKFGFAGQGNVIFGNNYDDVYHINIRTQLPILGTNTNEQSYTDEESYKSSNSSSINAYSMFLQSAIGLNCRIPSGHYFLGGYWSEILDPIEVLLEPNLNSTTPNSSPGYKDGNYIYLERDPEDRHTLIASSSKQRIIYDGDAMFNKILVAKVETDEEKPINVMVYYRNNIGYNRYSFN